MTIKATLRGWKLLWLDIIFLVLRFFHTIAIALKVTGRNLSIVWGRRDRYKYFPFRTQRGYKSVRHHKNWKRRGAAQIAKSLAVQKGRKKHTKNKKRKGGNSPR